MLDGKILEAAWLLVVTGQVTSSVADVDIASYEKYWIVYVVFNWIVYSSFKNVDLQTANA